MSKIINLVAICIPASVLWFIGKQHDLVFLYIISGIVYRIAVLFMEATAVPMDDKAKAVVPKELIRDDFKMASITGAVAIIAASIFSITMWFKVFIALCHLPFPYSLTSILYIILTALSIF
jgi:hypothetical protein